MQGKNIFELKPIGDKGQNLDGYKDDWPEGSIFEIIIVRAESPEEARVIVDKAVLSNMNKRQNSGYDVEYIASLQTTETKRMIFTPWGDDKMTICNAINNSDYDTEGETEILFPAELKNGGGGN